MRKSWKTTLGGLLMAAGTFMRPALPPDWAWAATACTGVGSLLLGLSARDNKVSSEEAGAKPS